MLSHLEFEQVKRALERMRVEGNNSGYSSNSAVKLEDVIELLMPYVEGFTAPNPHPVPPASAVQA